MFRFIKKKASTHKMLYILSEILNVRIKMQCIILGYRNLFSIIKE